MLDQLISQARQAEKLEPQSVVGMVRLDPSDPDLKEADTVVRALFSYRER